MKNELKKNATKRAKTQNYTLHTFSHRYTLLVHRTHNIPIRKKERKNRNELRIQLIV